MYALNEPTIQKIKEQDKLLNDTVQYIVPLAHGENLVGPAAYPSRKLPPIWKKQNYAQMMTGQPLQVTTSITDEDLEIWEHKGKLEEVRRFKEFAGRLFQPELSPAHKKRMQEVMPGWLEDQEKLIEAYHDFKKRVEILKLRGPQNEEDVILMWRLGYPSPSPLGTNPELASYLTKEVLGPHHPSTQEINAANDQFLRGVLNTNKRDMVNRALVGTTQSVFPSDDDTAYDKVIKPKLKPPYAALSGAYLGGWDGAPITIA